MTAFATSANGSGTARSATVREVHAWTNRPVWPQGIEVERPKETPAVPASLDWDKWIGPAPYRPYNPTYHPGNWRAWWDFGTGSLGDLGCHILDAPFWALKLKYPISVEGCISTYWHDLWKETEAQERDLPAVDDRAVQVPCPGRHARGQTDLVGRRHDAAAARRAGARPADGRQRRRRAVPRHQGHPDVRLLRPEPATDSRIPG